MKKRKTQLERDLTAQVERQHSMIAGRDQDIRHLKTELERIAAERDTIQKRLNFVGQRLIASETTVLVLSRLLTETRTSLSPLTHGVDSRHCPGAFNMTGV